MRQLRAQLFGISKSQPLGLVRRQLLGGTESVLLGGVLLILALLLLTSGKVIPDLVGLSK